MRIDIENEYAVFLTGRMIDMRADDSLTREPPPWQMKTNRRKVGSFADPKIQHLGNSFPRYIYEEKNNGHVAV